MKVIIGVGIPGCGKTTYLKPFAAEQGLVYVNPDDIRQELTGSASDHTQEIKVWRLVHERLVAGLQNTGVVIDATHTRIRDRRQIIKLCNQHGAKEIIAYWFNPNLKKCLERNAKRQRVVPEEALRKMHNRLNLNPPTTAEGFTKVIEINN